MYTLRMERFTSRNHFYDFFVLSGKKTKEVTKEILKSLESDGLVMATMAGIHSGVQTKIREINPKALFIPSANHSLNLCGVHAFSYSPKSITFFGTLESVYNFFSGSTYRW